MEAALDRFVKENNLHQCLECGKCTGSCPISRFEKSFSPRNIVENHLFRFADPSVAKKIWGCLTCGLCRTRCPSDVSFPEFCEELRFLNYKSGVAPSQIYEFSGLINRNFNPVGLAHEFRTDWISFRTRWFKRLTSVRLDAGTQYKPLEQRNIIKDKARTVYFIGCVTSGYRANTGIADATMQILLAANENVGILGLDERCCGFPSILSGNLESFESLAKHNVEEIRKRDAEKVVFTCAGCYKNFKTNYPKLLGELGFQVFHISELLERYFADGILSKPEPESAVKVTYHDPCDLGRACNIFEPPRKVLSYLGVNFKEMQTNRENALCCGGGGLVKVTENNLSQNVSISRIREAEEAGADCIVSGCPNCRMTLANASEASKSKLKVLDIVELAAQQLRIFPRE